MQHGSSFNEMVTTNTIPVLRFLIPLPSKYSQFCYYVRLSLAWIVYNAIIEKMDAVCVKRNFEYECWLLDDYSDQFEDVWMMGRMFSDRALLLLGDFV